MNQSTKIPTHRSDVRPSQIGPKDFIMTATPFETRSLYINNTPLPITIVLRSGVKLALPPQYAINSSAFIVRSEFHIRPNLRTEFQNFITTIDDDSSSTLKAIKEAYVCKVPHEQLGGLTIQLDYITEYSALKRIGGTFYDQSLDIIISLEETSNVPVHPYSYAGVLASVEEQLYETNPYRIKNNAILIVDNDDAYGVRYYNFLNSVETAVPFQMSDMKNGVYIMSDGGDIKKNKISMKSKDVIFMELCDETDTKLGLFRVKEDAIKSKEDINSEFKSRLMEMEMKGNEEKHIQMIEVLRQKRIETDTKHQQILNEMELKQKHLADELAASKTLLDQKIHSERVKDHYEERSYGRKDESEILKAVPTIIVGLAGAFMAFKAFG